MKTIFLCLGIVLGFGLGLIGMYRSELKNEELINEHRANVTELWEIIDFSKEDNDRLRKKNKENPVVHELHDWGASKPKEDPVK